MRIGTFWSNMHAASAPPPASPAINPVAANTATGNAAAPRRQPRASTALDRPGSPGPGLGLDQAPLGVKQNRVQGAMAVLEAGEAMGDSAVASAALKSKLGRVLKDLNRGDAKAAR